MRAVHEVIRLLDGNLALMNVNLQRYWRRSPNWIWADVDKLSDAVNDKECHFDVLKLSSTLLAFRSVANGKFLKRYEDYWKDMLCAIGDTINDPTTHLLVKEAVLSRNFFNIRYLLNLAEVSDVTPVLVGSGSMLNNTNLTTSLEVTVTLTQEVSNSRTWSTSTTFTTSLTVGFSVGIPEVSSTSGSVTVGTEKSYSSEMGTTTTTALSFQTTYLVNDVPPRTQVKNRHKISITITTSLGFRISLSILV